MKKIKFNKTFDSKGDFQAFHECEKFLKEKGFSIGSMQRDEPIGVMFGDYDIAKWRNISNSEREELHGQITGDKRNGPVTVTVFDNVPMDCLV